MLPPRDPPGTDTVAPELTRLALELACGGGAEGFMPAVAEEAARSVDTLHGFVLRHDGGSPELVAATGVPPAIAFPVSEDSSDRGLAALEAADGACVDVEALPDGPFAAWARHVEATLVLVVPVLVRGRPWGRLGGLPAGAPPPAEAEPRLRELADVVGTALAGAEAQTRLRALLQEESAWRRVAESVAAGASRDAILAAVVAEAFELLDVDVATLARFDPDGSAVVLAEHHAPPELSVGTRVGPGGDGIVPRVRSTGRSVRVDSYAGVDGDAAATARRIAVRGGAGAPIRVEGVLWGVMTGLTWDRPVPPGLEDRLARYAEVAATAISGAEARADLNAVADEQRALRRIAEFAASGAEPAAFFAAVVREAAELLQVEVMALAQYEPDGAATVVAVHGIEPAQLSGARQAPGRDGVADRVRGTGRAQRIDWRAVRSPDPGLLAPQFGIHVSMGAPVRADGELWGLLTAGTRSGELSPDVEDRLVRFAERLGTAIAAAQARTEVQRLAAEQAALRRVAELVARGRGERELFDVVAAEASGLMDGQATTLLRMDSDVDAVVVATYGDAPAPVGTELKILPSDKGTVAEILRTGRPARQDDYTSISGLAYARDDWGVNSSVGVPIVVDGRIWGVMGFTAARSRVLPGAELRLQQFAELVAAALANAQARHELQQLADDQAALRRVAELVARETSPVAVFDAVAAEASALLDGRPMTLTRFTRDDELVVVAQSRGPTPVGQHIAFPPDTLSDRVRRTASAVRVDDYSGEPDVALAATYGLAAAVAVPVTIDGEVWGMLTATSPDQPLPPGIEPRLTQFTELVAAAIANAESREQLTASRARVVATADEVRHKLQRDVHDGAQQRLVQTILTLGMALQRLEGRDQRSYELVDEALEHARHATSDLRQLVRGILPAALTRGGLRAGLESLASDSPIDVRLQLDLPELPTAVETTAYFVAAEALTNVVKHAAASSARVWAAVDEPAGTLVLRIEDDGAGGADVAGGSGLVGLEDRVGAARGVLVVDSPPGGGTTVEARLPIGG